LEENKKNSWATTADEAPEPIRASQTEYYDPNHPDADWSGFVRFKDGQRHHVRGHRSQNSGIIQTEEGLVSKNEKAQWSKKNKSHNPEAKDTSTIMGGVLDPDHDPYMTDAKRATLGLGTSRAQMTLMKQQMVRSTEHQHPGASRPPSSMAKENHQLVANNNTNSAPFVPSVSAKGTSRSLLSNLGSDLLYAVPSSGKAGAQEEGHNPRSVYRPK